MTTARAWIARSQSRTRDDQEVLEDYVLLVKEKEGSGGKVSEVWRLLRINPKLGFSAINSAREKLADSEPVAQRSAQSTNDRRGGLIDEDRLRATGSERSFRPPILHTTGSSAVCATVSNTRFTGT